MISQLRSHSFDQTSRYQILGKGRQAPAALWAWSFHHHTVPFHRTKTQSQLRIDIDYLDRKLNNTVGATAKLI